MDTNPHGQRAAVCAYATFSIAFVFVGLRIFIRSQRRHALGTDDVCVVLALLSSLACSVSIHIQVAKGGLGMHHGGLSRAELSTLGKGIYVSILAYNISLCFTQFSIVILCFRILGKGKKRTACYVAFVLLSIYTIYIVGISIVPCIPISHWWDGSPQGWCIPATLMAYVNAGLNIALHFLVVSLPLPYVLGMKTMSRSEKTGLVFVFALGLFVCIVSIIRLTSIHASAAKHDPRYDTEVPIWSTIDCNCAIIGACLPSLYPLMAWVARKGIFSNNSPEGR